MQRRDFLERCVVCGAAVFGGCSRSSPTSGGVREIEERFGGRDSLTLLTDPDKVMAFRLVDSEHRKTIEEYKTVGDSVIVPVEPAAELGKLLSSASSYLFDVTVSCTPNYGVRIQFSRGAKSLDVLFCFRCKVLATYVDGTQVSGAIFEPIDAELARTIRSLFPKDAASQTL